MLCVCFAGRARRKAARAEAHRNAYGDVLSHVSPSRAMRVALVTLAFVCAATLATQLTTPPANTSPSPRSSSPPALWRAQQASDVLANLPLDPNFQYAIGGLTTGPESDPRAVGRTPVLGTPLFVRGLGPSEGNEFLVPVIVDGT